MKGKDGHDDTQVNLVLLDKAVERVRTEILEHSLRHRLSLLFRADLENDLYKGKRGRGEFSLPFGQFG